MIQCPVKPASRDEALRLMKQGIEDIAANGVTAEELDKVVKYAEKNYADNQKKNEYWDSLITDKTTWNVDRFTGRLDVIKNLSSKQIQHFARKFLLGQGNCVTVSMLPENFSEEGMSGN